MPKLTLIGLCFWLYVAQKLVSGDLYLKVGGELVLKPDKSTVTDPITSILWKHGKNKVAEWDKDFGGLDIYAAFKERTTLDQTSGELRIRGLKKTDSGVYSVEFNSKLLHKTYTLSVIKAVPKPTITSSCNPDKTSCTLTCEGDTTDAEPVTYSWEEGERVSKVLDKELSVSKSTNGIKYTCKLSNAVSSNVSEPVGEVFGPERSSIGAVVTLVVVAIVAFAVIIGFLVWKKKTEYPQDTWIDFLRMYCGGIYGRICAKGTDGVQPEQGKSNADKAEKGQGDEDLYLKVGGELVLTPDKSTVPDSITSVLWKHEKSYVAEWENEFDRLTIYGVFKGRTTLNQTTGELRISGLKKTDSGVYSVEFNRKLLDKTYKISVSRGDDETTMNGSAAPGGDLDATEKGEANGEGSVLLKEDTVKYDNGKGETEENSTL
uniref:Ig-like domain-containing protein n=1 Tax=Oncorhynchus mykiss TaxID=8022 RepID=A0A8C7PD13_ONCMY